MAVGQVKIEEPVDDTDEWSTSTVTHIEYNPFGLFKVEIPQAGSLEDIIQATSAPKGEQAGIIDFSFLCNSLKVKAITGQDSAYIHMSWLKIPLNEGFDMRLSKTGEPWLKNFDNSVDTSKASAANPFSETIHFDQPLFSLFELVVMGDKKMLSKNDFTDAAMRLRFVDTPIFLLHQSDRWGGEYYDNQWLKIPLSNIIRSRKGPMFREVKFCQIPLIAIYAYERKGDNLKARFLDVTLASVFKRKAIRDKSDRWTIFQTIVGTVVDSRHDEETSRFSVLETPSYIPNLLAFSLYRSDKLEEGESATRLLRIPILGPVWSSWKEEEGGKTKHMPFPRLFFWATPKHAR
jgi:hypothetical protein